MPRFTGGQALVQSLVREGIDTLFGLPGVQLDWAYDALYEARDRIAIYTARHEQATAYMADGFARTTGRVGTCMVVPGPGVLNAGAALATAYACSSPVLCLAGDVPTDALGKHYGMLHEVDNQHGVLESVTKWATRPQSVAAIPGAVQDALQQVRTGRPRPVAVELPADILGASADVTIPDPAPVERTAGDPDALRAAAALLRAAERPVICSGGGTLLAGAWEELRAISAALEAPVVMTLNGRGALSDRNYLAHTGLSGGRLVSEADVVLAVGTRFYQPTQVWGLAPGAKTIRIDADPAELSVHGAPTVGIVGDAKLALAALRDALDGLPRHPSREAEMRDRKDAAAELLEAVQPQAAFSDAIRTALPEDAIVVSDLTQVSFYMTLGFPVYQPRTLIGPGYQGTLGSAFGTALGASVGNPDKRVVAIMGDGGFLYQVEELATLKHYGLNTIAVVFNDNAFGNVRRTQRQQFGGHVISADLTNPDFVALAAAFGVRGIRVDTPEALGGALGEALRSDGPALIEVPVGEMPSPWHLVAPGGGAYPVLLSR